KKAGGHPAQGPRAAGCAACWSYQKWLWRWFFWMVQTFQRMLTLNAGFNPKKLITMQVTLPASKYRENAQISALYDEVLRGLEKSSRGAGGRRRRVLGNG